MNKVIVIKKKCSILTFEIISILFIFVLGTLLHFTYDWSKQNVFVGMFSAVNESTWEHLKLLFFPMLITTIVGTIYYKKEYPNFLCAKTKGILIALSFLVIFFYTYTGILGKGISFINIGSFFLAVLIGEIYAYKRIEDYSCCNKLSIIILILLSLSFIIFTFYPLNIGLFKDPLAGCFKIMK